jgi:uncharacterized membrane protein
MIHVKRHIAKAITYRIVGTMTTMWLSYVFTGSVTISTAIGFMELVVKPVNYFIHERVWYKYIRYGVITEQEK